MESSLQRVSRLVAALEILSDQILGSIHAADYASALALQERAQPVIDEISRLMVEPGLRRRLDADTQTRVDRLLRGQLDLLARIEADRSTAKDELQLIRTAQARTQRFRTAYGSSGTVSPPSHYAETG